MNDVAMQFRLHAAPGIGIFLAVAVSFYKTYSRSAIRNVAPDYLAATPAMAGA